MTLRSRRAPRPDTPLDSYYRNAGIPKVARPVEQMDTSGLAQRKIHPLRDREFLTWLHRQPCSVKGLVDNATGQVHVCWSPSEIGYRVFESDPAHCGKAYSGKLKRSDAEAFPLCRHAHRQQEDAMNEFDRRFGIDRFEIAERLRDQFLAEKERKA